MIWLTTSSPTGEMEIFLTKEKFEIIWKLIDYDISGSVSLDEIFVFLFPDMKTALKHEMKIVHALRNQFNDMVRK